MNEIVNNNGKIQKTVSIFAYDQFILYFMEDTGNEEKSMVSLRLDVLYDVNGSVFLRI
jgi:hypothetical protein